MITHAPVLTNRGQALLMRALAGETITITRFKAGDGTLPPDAQIKTLTDLISTIVSFGITKVDDSQPGTIQISGSFDSTEITEEFYWRELGIFAKGEDNEEILYAYANDGEDAGKITPIETDVQTRQSVTMIVAIGEAEHVTVIIEPPGEIIYVSDLTIQNGHLIITRSDGSTEDAGLMVPNGSITATQIASNAVTAAKINAGAVTEVKIGTGAVSTNKLADGAVTAGKLAADAVTPDSIGAAKLVSGKVDPTQISSRFVTKNYMDAFTLTSDLNGKTVSVSNSTPVTITIPADSDAFPSGAEIEILQMGSGSVTFVAESGTNIYSLDGMKTIAGRYSCVCLKKINDTFWLLAGALA